MFPRRRPERRDSRFLGIGLLILSLIRVPLPQADYHNVRHHDAPGEVCAYHDHLLRWHPSANTAADVSLLHWHWIATPVDPGAGRPGSSDEGGSPASLPSLHAHLGDWPAPDWTGAPLLRPDARGRLIDLLGLDLDGPGLWDHSLSVDGSPPGPHPLSAWAIGGASVARVEILALISRLDC